MANYHRTIRENKICEYLADPNICRWCDQIIRPHEKEKISMVKKRKFCCRKCSMLWRNKNIVNSKTTDFLDRTKKEIYEQCRFPSDANAAIARNAKRLLQRIKPINKCVICGSTKRLEVCHIRSIADFSNDAYIYEINKMNNIIMLCPNCHYAFDDHRLSQEDM